MRKLIVAANWKMNKTRDEALDFILELNKNLPSEEIVDTIIFPQIIHLSTLFEKKDPVIKIGSQNIHEFDKGAYTGETSPQAVKEIGCEYVLIGHSERREMFNETDESVNKKIKIALSYKLLPIVCVGENLKQRENNETSEIVKNQIIKAFREINKEEAKTIVIAYEPIWAIGTGVTATLEQAEETCALIRQVIKSIYDEETGETIRIQYGGSVNLSNFKDLISMSNIDGALIGGASLDFLQFAEMLKLVK